jgi:hypothetical protein
MIKRRHGLIKFAGVERTVIGDDIQVSPKAPDFIVPKYEEVLAAAKAAIEK